MKIEEFNPNIAEIAEEVLLGPQAEIISKINTFNMRYGTTIKSTKTFRWSPGVGDQLKEIYMTHILDWDKKYSGVYHFFNRIDNRQWYHSSLRRSLNDINDKMTDFRRRGVTFQNNSDLVVETFNNLKNKALEELEAVEQMYSDQDLQVSLEIHEYDQGGYYYRYEFILPNPVMSIEALDGDGDTDHLVDIKLYPVTIQAEIDFIQHLNGSTGKKNNANVKIVGNIKAPSDTVYHPYIYSRARSSNEWYNVCLGDLSGDITSALVNFDIIAASMLLTRWTSHYMVNRTHPHNKPNMAYYGLPRDIVRQPNSEAYLAAFPHNTSTCGVPTAIEKIEDIDTREISITMDDTCNSINCQIKDKCNYWNNVINASQERSDNILYLGGDCHLDSMHSLLFKWRMDSDDSIISIVNETMGKLCEHDRYEDECSECLDREIMEHMNEVADEIIEENMTDEERTMRWVERQTVAFVNNTERRR